MKFEKLEMRLKSFPLSSETDDKFVQTIRATLLFNNFLGELIENVNI